MAEVHEVFRAGVVGHPIAHTLSPPIHEAALAHHGVEGSFEVYDVTPEDFGSFVRDRCAAGLRGLSVTIPHKPAAFDLADVRSPAAEATGAVNALVCGHRLEGGLEGHNTDVGGFLAAAAKLGVELAGRQVLVLGAGGAARAVVHALRGAGAGVTVANRTRARADALGTATLDLAGVPEALGGFELLVNTTSLGLSGEASPVDPEALEAASGEALRAVLDVVYRPGETALVRAARQVGLQAADGLSMLVFQAAEAFTLFFGLEAPLDVMFKAAGVAAGRDE